MSYSTQADLEDQLSSEELRQLTDDLDSGSINTTIANRAIDDADAEIDSYIGVRYDVPLATIPQIIKKVSVDIAIYNLYARRQILTPEARRQRYEDAIELLKNVSKGLVTLGTDNLSQIGGPDVTTNKEDRVFSRGLKSDNSTGTLDYY